jgi:hypothetical protein
MSAFLLILPEPTFAIAIARFCYTDGIDVRRADSLPELRAIDWWKAARCVKTKGVRRAARARIDDMMAIGGDV